MLSDLDSFPCISLPTPATSTSPRFYRRTFRTYTLDSDESDTTEAPQHQRTTVIRITAFLRNSVMDCLTIASYASDGVYPLKRQ